MIMRWFIIIPQILFKYFCFLSVCTDQKHIYMSYIFQQKYSSNCDNIYKFNNKLMHQNQVSRIHEHSTISRNNSTIDNFGRKSTILSTKKTDMQRNLRSNILMNTSHLKKVIYVRVNFELDSIQTQKFKDNLQHDYNDCIQFDFYKNIGQLTKVKFQKEPLSYVITTFEDREWAMKFSQNISNNSKLLIIIKCNDPQQFNTLKTNQNIKAILYFDDLQLFMKKEYDMFSDNYIDQMNQKRIKNKFYHKLNTNQVMNFYYHDDISQTIEPYINKISKNKKFKKTNFFHFKTFLELVKVVKTRKTQKKNQTKVFQQSKIIMSNEFGFRSEGNIVNTNQFMKDLSKTPESEDYYYLIIAGKHPQLKQIQKFWRSLKNAKILILENYATLEKFKVQMKQFAEQATDEQITQRQRITMSEKLIVIVHIDDMETITEIDQQQNYNFHSQKALFTNDVTLKAELWRIHQNEDYFGLLIIDQQEYRNYETTIQSSIHLNAKDQIDNFRVILKKRKTSENQDYYVTQYVQEPITTKKYIISPLKIIDQQGQDSLIAQIYRARNVFYHPAEGLIGTIVYIFIKKQKQAFTSLILGEIKASRRLKYEGYRDKQQLEYLLEHKTKNSECVLIIIEEKQLYQIRKLIHKLQNVYILLIGDEDELLFDPQILKIGKQEDIRDFIRQIPQLTTEPNFQELEYIQEQQNQENKNKIKIKQQCIKRYQKEEFQQYFYQIPGRPIIVIYFPNEQHTDNAEVFQTRIKNHFHEEVTFKNYENQAQIRDMDDTQQPLQFLIITDGYLKWTKKFAEQEKNKQFQILFFTKTESLNQYRELIDKEIYKRFKIISNKWKYLEQYIIGKAEIYSKKKQDLFLHSNQNLHLFLTEKQINIEQELGELAIEGNQIAKRCKYYYYDPTKQTTLIDQLKKHNQNHKAFVIINQSNPIFLNQNVVLNAIKDYPKAKTILITTKSILDYNKPNAKTQVILQNNDEAVRYIADIGFRKALEINEQPIIFVDNNNLSWRYFIKKNAILRKKFRFEGYNDLNQLQYKIKKISSQYQDQMIWILTVTDDECLVITERCRSYKNVKYIILDDKYKNPVQSKQIVLGSCDRDEIQLYLLNYNKRSKTKIVPSQHLPALPVLLYFSKLKIKHQQLKYWRDRIGAKIIPFDDVQALKNGILARQASKKQSGIPTVYLVMTNQQEQQVNEIIKKIKNSNNIKKIIVNKIAIDRKNKYEHPNICYLADTISDLNTFLENLRYTIRKPPRKIKEHFTFPITHIYLFQYDFDRQFITQLQRYNASLRVHFYKDLKDLQRSINAQVPQKSNLVVVGNTALQSGISPSIRKSVKFINSKKFAIDYEPSATKILEADEINEVKLYLRNIPETRFDDAKKILRKVHLYFSPFALKQENMKIIKNKAKQISQRNKGISLHGYQTLDNLGKFLSRQNNKQKHILMIHKNQEAATEQWLQKYKSMNGNNQNINTVLFLENVTKRPKEEVQHKIFVSNNQQLIQEFFENIPLIKLPQNKNDQSHSNIQLESYKSRISENKSIVRISSTRTPIILTPTFIKSNIKPFSFIQQKNIPSVNFNFQSTRCQPIIQSQSISKPKVQIVQLKPIKPFVYQKQQQLNNIQFYCSLDELVPADIKPQYLPIQQNVTKIGICYQKNSKPSQRTLNYILDKSDASIQFNKYSYDDLDELQDGGLAMIHDESNKVMILTNSERQNQQYKFLCQKYPKCRLVRYSDIDEMDLVFDLGWKKKNIQTPYKNEQAIKMLMQKSEKANLFIPIQKFKNTLYNFPNTTVHLYRTFQNVANTIKSQSQSDEIPTINIIVTFIKFLNETIKVQKLYPNVRIIVLCDDAPINEIDFFKAQGDKYWYLVDDNNENIEKQLYKLFQNYPLGKNKSKTQFIKNILFYNQNQEQYLNNPQLENYYKILYENEDDLNYKIQNLKPHQIPFILRTDAGDINVQKLQKKIKPQQRNMSEIKNKIQQSNKTINLSTQIINTSNQLTNKSSIQIKNPPAQVLNAPLQSTSSNSQIKNSQSLKIIRLPVTTTQTKVTTNPVSNIKSIPLQQSQSHQIIKSQIPIINTNRLPNQSNYLSTSQINRIATLFPIKYLHSFLKIQYYYLSNVIMNSPDSPIRFMSKQELERQYINNKDVLMIVFCQKGNQMFLPPGFLNNSRVRIILVTPGQQVNDNYLTVQFNQKQNAVNTIRYFDSNVIYCLYKSNEPASEYKLYQILSENKDTYKKQYENLNHLKSILESIRYRNKFIHLICLVEQQSLVKKIFEELDIRSYYIHVVTKIVKRSRRNILNVNQKIEYDLVGIDVKNDQDRNKQLWRILNSPNRIVSIDKNNNSQTLKQVVEKQKVQSYDKKSMVFDQRPTIVAMQNDVPQSIIKSFSKLNNCFIIYNAKGKSSPNLPYNSKVINNWRELQFLLNPQKQRREINTQDYDNVRVVYGDVMDKNNKIRLLLMSEEKQEIIPTKFVDTNKLQNLIDDNNSNLFIQVIGQDNSEKIKNNNSVDMHNKQFKELAKKRRLKLPYFLDIIHEETESQIDQSLSKYNHLSQKQIDELLLRSEIKKNQKKKSKADDSSKLMNDNDKQDDYSIKQNLSKFNKKKRKLNKLDSPNGISSMQIKNTSQINNRNKRSINTKKINQNLYKFRPILNGQFIKILLPTENKELQTILKDEIQQLMRIQYFSLNDLQSYLQRNTKDPTIVLLLEDYIYKANQLQQKYPNIRIIMYSNNFRNNSPAGLSLDMDNNGQIVYLMKELINQNANVQKKLGADISKIKIISNGFLTQRNQSRQQTLPNFNSNKKIKIFYNPLKNTAIKQAVQKVHANKVHFIEYTTPITLAYKLEQLGVYQTEDDINLIIQNQDQIEQIEQLKLDPNIQTYLIRYISSQFRDYQTDNQKVIFTGVTSQEIAIYINNLLSPNNRTSIKRYPYFRSGNSILVNSYSDQNLKNLSQQKKYRRKYIPSTFGTAPRFQYYDDKYIPTEITTTGDSVRNSSLDAKPFRRFRIKQKSTKKGLIFSKRDSAVQSPYML